MKNILLVLVMNLLMMNQKICIYYFFCKCVYIMHIDLINLTTAASIKKMNKCLYDGSPLSADMSWCTIMYFAVKNRLSYSALEELLELVKLHCPSPNVCPPSLYKFKAYFNFLLQDYSYLKFCSNCMAEVQHEACTNRNCSKVKAKLCYLLLLPIQHRLFLLTRCMMPANCLIIYVSIIDDQLVPACDNSEVLRDIYDGEVFQHLMKPPNSLSISVNTGLILTLSLPK